VKPRDINKKKHLLVWKRSVPIQQTALIAKPRVESSTDFIQITLDMADGDSDENTIVRYEQYRKPRSIRLTCGSLASLGYGNTSNLFTGMHENCRTPLTTRLGCRHWPRVGDVAGRARGGKERGDCIVGKYKWDCR
jgi:hypothetical protein